MVELAEHQGLYLLELRPLEVSEEQVVLVLQLMVVGWLVV